MISPLTRSSPRLGPAPQRFSVWSIVGTALVLAGCASLRETAAGREPGPGIEIPSIAIPGIETIDEADEQDAPGEIPTRSAVAESDESSASADLPGFGHSADSTEDRESDGDAPPDSVAFNGNDWPLASPVPERGPLVGPGEPGPFALRWLRNPFAPCPPSAAPPGGGFLDPMDQLTDSNGGPPGMDGPGGPDGGPDGGPPGGFGGQDEPGYAATWYPSAAVAGQGTELGVLHQRLGVDVPLWFQGADALMMSLSVDETHFSGRATLPDTQRAFPSDLWNIQVGLKHMHQYANGWTSMLMFDVGSASDKPFQAVRDVSVQLGGFLIIPAKNERDSWMLGVLYSPLGSPSFPIPLISYHWKPSETFEMNIGLPSSLKWQATDRLSFDLSYFPILSIDALATYKLTEQLHLYGGYQNVSRSWFLADRVHRNDQFFANERRLIVGLKHELTKSLKVDFHTGYAFDRQFGEGDFQTSLSDRVNLQSGVFAAGRLTWSF